MAHMQPPGTAIIPSRQAMMRAFFVVGITAFGGALPWLRRAVVERRAWLSEKEFLEVLTLCQALPGPNVVNAVVFLGARWHGLQGATLAFLSLMSAPLAIVLVLGAAFASLPTWPGLTGAMLGLTAGAVAYLVRMTVDMARPLLAADRPVRSRIVALLLVGLAVALSFLARWPMGWVLLLCGSLGVLAVRRGWL